MDEFRSSPDVVCDCQSDTDTVSVRILQYSRLSLILLTLHVPLPTPLAPAIGLISQHAVTPLYFLHGNKVTSIPFLNVHYVF